MPLLSSPLRCAFVPAVWNLPYVCMFYRSILKALTLITVWSVMCWIKTTGICQPQGITLLPCCALHCTPHHTFIIDWIHLTPGCFLHAHGKKIQSYLIFLTMRLLHKKYKTTDKSIHWTHFKLLWGISLLLPRNKHLEKKIINQLPTEDNFMLEMTQK